MKDFTGSLWVNGHIITQIEGKVDLKGGPDGMPACRGRFRRTLNLFNVVGAKYWLEIHGGPTLEIIVNSKVFDGPLLETWFDFESTP